MGGNDKKMEINNNKKKRKSTTTARRTNVSIFINYMLRRSLKSDNHLSCTYLC